MDNDKQKQITLLNQSKGQLEASINKVEDHLTREEYEEYCDAMATCTTYIQKITKRIKDKDKNMFDGK